MACSRYYTERKISTALEITKHHNNINRDCEHRQSGIQSPMIDRPVNQRKVTGPIYRAQLLAQGANETPVM